MSKNSCNCSTCSCDVQEVSFVETYKKVMDDNQELMKRLAESEKVDLGKGTKFDSGKPKLSYLPKEGLEYEARAFEYGASKYLKNNFRKGMEWSRVIDAAFRHLTAFNNKEDFDPESGLHHLAHLKANVAMLIYYIENKVGTDDR